MSAFAVDKHGVHASASTGQPGAGMQRVAAVRTAADEQHD